MIVQCVGCRKWFTPSGRQERRIKRQEPVWCEKRCRYAGMQRKFRENNIMVKFHIPREAAARLNDLAISNRLPRNKMLRAMVIAWSKSHSRAA